MAFLTINESNIILWKNFLEQVICFLNLYQSLLDGFILDFFCDNHWEKLPEKWKYFLDGLSLHELSQILDNGSVSRFSSIPPLTLLAFRKTCFFLTLPRNPLSSIWELYSILDCKEYFFASEWKSPQQELSSEGQHYSLHHVFRKHLKPKKQHEVARTAQVATLLYEATKAKIMVDVGSGQGHLSRLMSYKFNIPCICLDTEEAFIEGARKFDQELENNLNVKKLNSVNGPNHTRYHLDMSTETISETIKSSTHDQSDEAFILVGLHCCGNLGPNLLRLFDKMDSCKGILLVGCCYMKLSCAHKDEVIEEAIGYPLSTFVGSVAGHDLSYCARELSCHAIESYIKKLRSDAESLKVHCYRAVLEELIVRKNPKLAHSGLRSVKNTHKLRFQEYAMTALASLDRLSFSEEELSSQEVDRKMSMWKRVVIFYSVRLMLAPTVETLILLDRILYLFEKGYKSVLAAAIFDPALSPRNMAVVAKKHTS